MHSDPHSGAFDSYAADRHARIAGRRFLSKGEMIPPLKRTWEYEWMLGDKAISAANRVVLLSERMSKECTHSHIQKDATITDYDYISGYCSVEFSSDFPGRVGNSAREVRGILNSLPAQPGSQRARNEILVDFKLGDARIWRAPIWRAPRISTSSRGRISPSRDVPVDQRDIWCIPPFVANERSSHLTLHSAPFHKYPYFLMIKETCDASNKQSPKRHDNFTIAARKNISSPWFGSKKKHFV